MDELKSLVSAAQSGNLDAFTRLVTQFQDMAFAVAYAMLGDADLAEDAAQEALIEAYLSLPKLQEPAAFPGWLRTIVVRQVHRLIRGKRLSLLPLDAAEALAAEGSNLDLATEADERNDQMYTVINGLPEQQRQAIMLFYIGGYSQLEIADFLEVRVSTIKNRLYAARRHLRERILEMVQDNLHEHRPSKDNSFVTEVMALIQATQEGDLAQIEVLLANRPALAKAKDEQYGQTALHYAAWTGHQAVAELLLAHGADIDLHDEKHDAPPIGWAGENDQHEMFEFLLAKGAKLNIGQAAAYGSLELVRAFLTDNPSLIRFGVGDDVQTWSPLHSAALFRRHEILTFLLANGADVNAKTRFGATPLHGAVQGDDKTIVETLVAKCADVNAQDHNGRTPLHRAAWNRSAAIVVLLLQHRAEVNCKDNHGYTPMQLASAKEGTIMDGWGESKTPDPQIIQLLKQDSA